MAAYSLNVTVAGTINGIASGAFTAMQMLMPASRACRLISVTIVHENVAGTQDPGKWVVDEISAVSAGATRVPLKFDPRSRTSEITDTTKTISVTSNCNNTAAQDTIWQLQEGLNLFGQGGLPELISALTNGWGIRRAISPSGNLDTHLSMVWEEI